MKRRFFVILITLLTVIILVNFFVPFYLEGLESTLEITLHSWWDDDDVSTKLFSELFDKREIKDNYKKIEIYSVFGEPPSTKNEKTLYVQFSGESRYHDPSLFDVNIIPVNPIDHSNVVIIPFGFYHILKNKINPSKFTTTRNYLHKKKFCLFSVTNGSCKERNDFFTRLSQYKKVDSCGKFMNNLGYNCPGNYESEEYCDFLSQYKFLICFENISKHNYLTEKLINAYHCNTIPIYWGCPNVSDYINMKSILYLKPNYTESELNELIEKIKELDNNNDLYLEMYNQPLFNSNTLDVLDKDKIRDSIDSIIDLV